MDLDEIYYRSDWQNFQAAVMANPGSNFLSFSRNFTHLSEGNHSIQIDVPATFWKIEGAESKYYLMNNSAIVYFVIDKTTSVVTIAPSKQQPTLSPSITASLTPPIKSINHGLSDLELSIIIGIVSLTIMVGIAVFLRKKYESKQSFH
jgi:hypothetical protein